ncbi:MAG: LPS export ABC transporter periplasmic protein LptC [Comamonadaceae bacterium]|nr:LPS export ABC transporter periplasmic protein LptC [Comamonadaceae bacterium]
MMRLLRQAWDQLTLYLPVFLMGVLAMATYWLVRSTPVFVPPGPATAALHQPDYFMRNFSVKTFDAAGKLKSEVLGGEARHFPDTDMLEIEQVRIRSFDPQGRLTTATARRAIANSDATEVQLIGGARVVRTAARSAAGKVQPTMTFTGEFLHAFMNAERVKSHKPVELTRGKDTFTSDSMDFDNKLRVMQLHGRVRGTLVPTPAP